MGAKKFMLEKFMCLFRPLTIADSIELQGGCLEADHMLHVMTGGEML